MRIESGIGSRSTIRRRGPAAGRAKFSCGGSTVRCTSMRATRAITGFQTSCAERALRGNSVTMRPTLVSTLTVAVTAALIVCTASVAAAQTYAQTDIAYGAKIYGEQCTVCHGATGDIVAGVDLRANRFKRVSSDFDLFTVITTGVPGTG